MSTENDLSGLGILVVEDSYLIACDICETLRGNGARIVGPFASVDAGLAALGRGDAIDGAVLDVNLGDESSAVVARTLAGRSIPFLFVTGYDRKWLGEEFANVPCLAKPLDRDRLSREAVHRFVRNK